MALTSTAFCGVLAGIAWLVPALMVIAAVGLTGLTGRALNAWPPLVVLTQLGVVLVALAMLFSSKAIAGVFPGPAAVDELLNVLARALEVVRTGVPPVSAEPALQCLLSFGLGLVAVLVDAITVAAGAPAVAGLVLLCVFALPASLSDTLLPWWTFVAGAAGFSVLLVSGGRGLSTRSRYRMSLFTARSAFGQQFAVVGGTAIVIALLAGATFTGVGTEGRLPGDRDSTAGDIGVRPFTSLRGQLNRDRTVDLFRVRGLPQQAYLRVMTLRDFNPDSGWVLGTLTQGVDAGGPLPLPDGTVGVPPGRQAQVQIEPLGYRDPWLPAFGVPLRVNPPGQGWRYDPAAGTLFTQLRQDLKPYSERLVLPEPSPDQLRAANSAPEVDPAYLHINGVAPEITELAKQITAQAPTRFDKAVALNRFFTDPANGFTYDLETAPAATGNALSDFLLRGKRGYCEQFASSMAVLLRSVGIPSRVAVGFTSGYGDGSERTITTADAHAWVEAYFPGAGWITFDPTPLTDGRAALPRYLNRDVQPVPPPAPQPGQPVPPTPTPGQQPQPAQPGATSERAAPPPPAPSPPRAPRR